MIHIERNVVVCLPTFFYRRYLLILYPLLVLFLRFRFLVFRLRYNVLRTTDWPSSNFDVYFCSCLCPNFRLPVRHDRTADGRLPSDTGPVRVSAFGWQCAHLCLFLFFFVSYLSSTTTMLHIPFLHRPCKRPRTPRVLFRLFLLLLSFLPYFDLCLSLSLFPLYSSVLLWSQNVSAKWHTISATWMGWWEDFNTFICCWLLGREGFDKCNEWNGIWKWISKI